jgi:parvulin-like peptidyl-prolyl isomerase
MASTFTQLCQRSCMSVPNILKIGDRSLSHDQILPLIEKYRLVPQLAREILIDEAIQDHDVTEAEHQEGCNRFYQQQQIANEQDLEKWLQQQRLERADLVDLVTRELRLQKFKATKWESLAESYFCKRKSQIDQVIFSMIRVKDLDVAEEIYFRLVSQEASFVELAPLYSAGIEAKTKGISGPVELGKLDPALANVLVTLQPTEVLPPTQIGDWWVVAQLEAMITAELDDEMRQRLTEELFNQWVYEEVQKLMTGSLN